MRLSGFLAAVMAVHVCPAGANAGGQALAASGAGAVTAGALAASPAVSPGDALPVGAPPAGAPPAGAQTARAQTARAQTARGQPGRAQPGRVMRAKGGPKVWRPVPIGRYGAWQAATHQSSGAAAPGGGDDTVCYALTYATSSQPLFQGRGHVVLTVAMRPHDRDAVAILLGYSVLPHAGASVLAGGKRLHFYLEGRSAFAPHGHEAVEAFAAGKQAVGSFPGPRGLTLTDVFSLDGFAAAYAAIVHACPPPGGAAPGGAAPVGPVPGSAVPGGAVP